MKEIARLKEAILKEYPRHTKTDTFQFACHNRVSCFNACCADVNIFLTPYDILRMKNHLGMTSKEFLDRYVIFPIDRNQKYPVALLKMDDSREKRCQFVDPEKGCTIYDNRPWACRMYPVGLASPQEGVSPIAEEFYFILKDPICKGFEEGKRWTIAEWLDDQGIADYNELGELFKEIILHPRMQAGQPLDEKKMEMFFLVCYNLDDFRRFIFESRFLERFEVDEHRLDQIRTDDVELMRFGFEWLKFSLFGEPAMTIKPGVLDAKKKELESAKK